MNTSNPTRHPCKLRPSHGRSRIDTRNENYKIFYKLQKCTRLRSLPHVPAPIPRTSADLNTFSRVSPSLQVHGFDRHRPCCC